LIGLKLSGKRGDDFKPGAKTKKGVKPKKREVKK
jgi:hypothetical protein